MQQMGKAKAYTLFLRVLNSGKAIYYYQYRDEYGRRQPAKSTGCTSLAKAKRYCQKLFNENVFSPSPSMKFEVFVRNFFAEDSEYCKWRVINGHAVKPETIRRYNISMKCQILPFFEEMPLNKISSSTVKDWILWAYGRWAPKTINNAQGTLNLIFEAAVDKNLIAKNPLDKIPLRKIQKKKRELLTVEEIKTIYNSHWAKDIERKAFLLAACTGMRIGEIVALSYSVIHDTYIDVKSTLTEHFGIGSTKTNVSRYVPIPDNFPFPQSNSKWVFESSKGKEPMKSHCVYNATMRICKKLGIDTVKRGITVHSLRNFFISYLRSKNVTEAKIRAVVGHADETMTDVYTYWKPDMFPEVYAAQKELFLLITK